MSSSDAQVVLRTGRGKIKYRRVCKTYTLSDGSVVDATECARRFEVNVSTMYTRLAKGITDIDTLSQKPTKGRRSNNPKGYVPLKDYTQATRDRLEMRPFFNGLSHLWMKQK